jgi:hypothetical protein
MLEIKKVKTYEIPKYPQGEFVAPAKTGWSPAAAGAISTSLSALLLYSACGPIQPFGVVGPPPMPPNLITEQEARNAIKQIFQTSGVVLADDVVFSLKSDNRTFQLVLDGFNEKLKIGYEYISQEDRESFNPAVVSTLDKDAAQKDGPFIKTIDGGYYFSDAEKSESMAKIEKSIKDFINYLKANGVL